MTDKIAQVRLQMGAEATKTLAGAGFDKGTASDARSAARREWRSGVAGLASAEHNGWLTTPVKECPRLCIKALTCSKMPKVLHAPSRDISATKPGLSNIAEHQN